MAREVELKLEVAPAVLRTLNDAPWLRRLADGPPRRRRLVSVYFDATSRPLREAGMSLRVRQADGQYVQTVKAGKDATDRLEWERPLKDASPDRRLARHTALEPFTGKKTWRELRPVFETDVTRTSVPVRYRGSRIEIALDHGRVKAGKNSLPVHEVELELKEGELADLSRLARHFAGQAALGLRSKAERGYALADGHLHDHVKAQAVTLNSDMTAAEGFRAIAFSCLHHLAANRDAIRNGDFEGVHQMRVGLRRLRAALSLFKRLIEGPELEKIKQALKWMSGELAAARDFDVFLHEARASAGEQPVLGLDVLEKDLKARRGAGLARARRMIESRRYRRILLDTGLWLTGGDWATSDDAMRKDLRDSALTDMAREILSARTAKVMKKARKFDRLDARGRHKLRIAVKKLRYGAGFFQSLFEHCHKQQRFMARLKDMQSALGRLNDLRTHRQFAAQAVHRRTGSVAGAYALGVVGGEERQLAAACMDAAAKASSRLRKAPRFWV
ncbi:MAG TPA: CHAD domain-containing protein [Rhizomicrobium sp.]|nr:CHAD domain-containing protein [Rhizomicrobium sp.]